MLYVVRFYDRPDRLTVRNQFLQAHVAWLDEHRDQVLIGGSLRDAPGVPPVGGLWLVEAESKAAVEELMKSDPFWVSGLRKRYEIFFWSRAFPERKVSV